MNLFSKRLLFGCVLLALLPLGLALWMSWNFFTPQLRLLSSPEFQQQFKNEDQQIPFAMQRMLNQLKHSQKAIRAGYLWMVVAFVGGALVLVLFGWGWLLRGLSVTLGGLRLWVRESTPSAEGSFPFKRIGPEDPILGLQTDLKVLISQLNEQQQNEVFKEQVDRWQDIARRLAHEIKNPLTPILLTIQELHGQYDGEEVRYQKLLDSAEEIVREEIETLRRLVEEFSAFAKLPEVRLELRDLNEVFGEFLDSYGWFEDRCVVHFEPADSPLWSLLDRALFKRVLYNLTQNAIEAGSKEITLRVGRVPEGRLLCQIEDRGPGIPEHLQSRIFTPYFTTKQFGSGLGLAITKKIIIDHGGSIKVGPNIQGGATFTIFLPAVARPFEHRQES